MFSQIWGVLTAEADCKHCFKSADHSAAQFYSQLPALTGVTAQMRPG